METKGLAPVVAIVILAAVSGSVATPVAIDTIDVDPDNPLYALEKFGEVIKRVSDETRLQERLQEFTKMCEKGHGSRFTTVFSEYCELREKLISKYPENAPERLRVKELMRAHEAVLAKNRALLALEAAASLKKNVTTEEDAQLCENIMTKLTEVQRELAKLPDVVEAKLELVEQQLEQLREKYRNRVEARVQTALEARHRVRKTQIEEKTEVETKPVENIEAKLETIEMKISKLEAELAVVSQMITPAEVAVSPAGGRAATRLLQEAKELKEKAEDAITHGKLGRAFGLLTAAERLLTNAERILEHAENWEKEHENVWKECKAVMEIVKERVRENLGKPIEALKPMEVSIMPVLVRQVVDDYTKTKKEYLSMVENLIAREEREETSARGELSVRMRELSNIGPAHLRTFIDLWPVPWKFFIVPVEGKVTAGVLKISGTENRSYTLELPTGTATVVRTSSVTAEGNLEEGRIKGEVKVRLSVTVNAPAGSFDWQYTGEGTFEGSAEPAVKCVITGKGTVGSSGDTEVGSWQLDFSFDMRGSLIGQIVGETFRGHVAIEIFPGARTVRSLGGRR